MIEKPKRPKQPNIQDRQPPRTLQELINRYDLDNTKIYDFLDGLVELINININNLNDQKANKVINITNAGTNLNDYKQEGEYYFGVDYTPTNIPTGVNGWLKVIIGNQQGYNIVKQIWYRHGTPNNNDYETYVRIFSSNIWSDWKRFAIQSDVVNKSGDVMTGGLHMQGNPIGFGSGGNIFFKEDGYGDKFRILPYFSGVGSANKLIIQSTVGGAGEDPQNWKDLVYIHADNGYIELAGNIGSKSQINYGSWHSMALTRSDQSWLNIMLFGTDLLKQGTYSIVNDFKLVTYGTTNGTLTIPRSAIGSIVRTDWGFEINVRRSGISGITGGEYNGVAVFFDDGLVLRAT